MIAVGRESREEKFSVITEELTEKKTSLFKGHGHFIKMSFSTCPTDTYTAPENHGCPTALSPSDSTPSSWCAIRCSMSLTLQSTSRDQIWKTSENHVRQTADPGAGWNNTVLPLHHLPHGSYHTATALLSAWESSNACQIPHWAIRLWQQCICTHFYYHPVWINIAIKLLLQQLTIVPEALQFQDIPVNT